MFITAIQFILSATAGAVIGSVSSCIPGLHVYNILGLLILLLNFSTGTSAVLPAEVLIPFFSGMVTAYAILNTVPSVLLAAPDESAVFTVLPGQKYLMSGRGYEATILTTTGALGGLAVLLLFVGCAGPSLLPQIRRLLLPHMHWVLWCVISFMLLSEWPKGGTTGPAGWRKFIESWKSTGAGLLTFLLSGILGFILFYKSPVSATVAFQNIMPAFAGLFTIPWLLLNIVCKVRIPGQTTAMARLDPGTVLKGTFAGGLGGGFAAFFPGVTGGIGGMLAGHATALRDDRAFLISQGASKFVYYAGGFLLLFVPDLGATRGGASWMMKSLYVPHTWRDYYLALAALAITGAICLLLVSPLTKATIMLTGRYGYTGISKISLLLIIAIVFLVTGTAGLAIMAVAAGIGLIPVLSGSRRMNCLGVILLPLACNMAGIGATVAGFFNLL